MGVEKCTCDWRVIFAFCDMRLGSYYSLIKRYIMTLTLFFILIYIKNALIFKVVTQVNLNVPESRG